MDKSLKLILNKLSSGIIVLNEDKQVIFANDNVKKFFKGKSHSFLGDYLDCDNEIFKEVICNNKQNCDNCFLKKAFDLAIETEKEQVIKDIKFTANDYEINITCKINYISKSRIIILEFLDILKEQEKFNFFMKAFDNCGDIIFFKNKKLQYIYINQTGLEFFGRDDILYKTDMDLMPTEHAIECLEGDLITLKTGKFHTIEYIGNRIFRTSKEFVNGGILALAQDITEEYHAKQLANIDDLTGLLNKKKYNETMNEIFDNKNSEFYLAIIDLDDLRNINNNYGHLIGDKYLKSLGKILKENTDGTFFRIGGDEFAALIPKNEKSITSIFDDIYLKISNLKFNPKLSISCGIKKIDYSKSNIQNFEETDFLLYEIKKSQKGIYILK